jgi:hypothetical protein
MSAHHHDPAAPRRRVAAEPSDDTLAARGRSREVAPVRPHQRALERVSGYDSARLADDMERHGSEWLMRSAAGTGTETGTLAHGTAAGSGDWHAVNGGTAGPRAAAETGDQGTGGPASDVSDDEALPRHRGQAASAGVYAALPVPKKKKVVVKKKKVVKKAPAPAVPARSSPTVAAPRRVRPLSHAPRTRRRSDAQVVASAATRTSAKPSPVLYTRRRSLEGSSSAIPVARRTAGESEALRRKREWPARRACRCAAR